MDAIDLAKEYLKEVGYRHRIFEERVSIKARPLSSEEAIGNPEDKDYPLVKGKERMIQAELKGFFGQAFTDMYGNYEGTLSEILSMDITNNFRRAIFTSTLNAVMRCFANLKGTIHCKDQDPPRCSQELVKYIYDRFGMVKIAMVGFQPRMVEALSKQFEVKVTDLDADNVGKEKFGVKIEGPDKTSENLQWTDLALVTGTTFVNNTYSEFVIKKPVIFYGVTVAGPAALAGLERFCPYGR
jgi:uncharacterized protein (DUF4213/DUF364 family)